MTWYRWYILETNYDPWNKPPASDDRRDAGIAAMNQVGKDNMNPDQLYKVMLNRNDNEVNSLTYSNMIMYFSTHLKEFYRNNIKIKKDYYKPILNIVTMKLVSNKRKLNLRSPSPQRTLMFHIFVYYIVFLLFYIE